jgi:hypothetical protein
MSGIGYLVLYKTNIVLEVPKRGIPADIRGFSKTIRDL